MVVRPPGWEGWEVWEGWGEVVCWWDLPCSWGVGVRSTIVRGQRGREVAHGCQLERPPAGAFLEREGQGLVVGKIWMKMVFRMWLSCKLTVTARTFGAG